MACSGTRPRAPPLWLHYTAALVVVPLLIAIIASPAGARARAAAVGVIVTSGLALLPLMIDQLGRGHEEGVAAQARLNAANLIEVLGAPFYGRTEDHRHRRARCSAVLLAVGATLLVDRGHRRLIALTGPAVVLVATVVSSDVVIARYVVVTAPFALIAVAFAVV